MTSQKFHAQDRRNVRGKVEKHYGVKLSPVGSHRKYLEDEPETYCVLGGYGDWHGIPPDMIEEEEKRDKEGILVIASGQRSAQVSSGRAA